MKILQLIKKALTYNIFDDFLDQGAERMNSFPEDPVWSEKAQMFHIDNLTINYGSRGGVWVAGLSDSVVIAGWRKDKATKILIRHLKENPDIKEHPSKIKRWWNKENRPFIYGALKVGFGRQGDKYILQHIDYLPDSQRTEN